MAEDSSLEQSPVLNNSGRKRKRPDPSELCQLLYDSIRNHKKEDGTMLCDTFIRAPKRRQEPSYYDVVANPIDLLRVQQKLKTDSYEDVDELTADVELLVKNAKAFYKADSTEHQDANLLWDIYNLNKNKLLEQYADEEPLSKIKKTGRPRKSANQNDGGPDDISETSSAKADDDMELYEDLFTSVMTTCDDNSRPLHTMFQLLPSKKIYPDYYDVIEHPIDLKFIATKIQTSAYTNLNEMEKDFLQMIKNACTFNEPGSQIYKDAKTLKKVFLARKAEIESGKFKLTKVKRRQASLSAATAALKEPEESDDENDEDMETEGDGPMWHLFDQLYNTANASDHPNAPGTPLGESLWKLPNRRFHPEYYFQVKKPISMAQIRNKLKKVEYSNITDLTGDLYLMIDNAKKAFPPSHKTHKDAVKMLKILNQKLVDQDDSDMEDGEVSMLSATSAVSNTNSSSPSTPINVPKKKGRPRLHPLPLNSSTPTSMLTQGSSFCATINSVAVQGTTVVTSSASPTPAILNPVSTSPKNRFPNNPMLKKKLIGLQKFLAEYTIAGRRPMTMFWDKPSKKAYPDYYEVIQHPIDMTTIEQNIKNDRYYTLDDVVGDFRLMFSNCRRYNEEGSMIYEDSNILERALNEKLKEFSGINDRRLVPKIVYPSVKGGRRQPPPLYAKLRQLYDAIRDYLEPKANRQLALIFMKLPSKNDYPDYYDIIRNPIDMEKISHKLKTQFYDNVDELATDFMLMFENACKYNEPDSQIYKDALVLQQVCLQTKHSLRDYDDTVPDVPHAVQEILLFLFTTFYNHQDEEGRCFSDSLAELPEYDEIDGKKVRAISLDLIKRRLDKGLYKRLDIFQEDIFSCLERARRLSRTDSQIFEDSIELQAFFIKKRDELCKDVLSSPAMSYSAMHLSATVEAVRQSKLLQEEHEHEENDMSASRGESMTIDQKVYTPGDFVYYDVPENKIPGIIYIERLWTNNENIKMMYGNVFLRPFETFHITTRKFLEQELFKSDQHQAVPLNQLGNKCYVMSAKEYFKLKPEGFADKDVYVCESRYSTKLKVFKKIKNWSLCSDTTKLIARDVPLEPKRTLSVFKERVEKHKGELAELQLQEALIEKEKPNLLLMNSATEDENTYYEQYNTICSGVVKTGDYVYVATENGKQSIAQIHSIWETKDGKTFFRGPWLLTPPEVPGTGSRFFYRQELMLSTIQETNPIVGIVGRCSVLGFHEYTSCRPTEIPESDVFVCESIYDEMKKQIRRNQQHGIGLKKFTHSQMVTPDEIYHFKRGITLVKVSAGEIAALQEHLKCIPSNTITGGGSSAILGGVGGGGNISMIDIMDIKMENSHDMLGMMEDSLDGGTPSVGSDILATSSPAPSTTNVMMTPAAAKKKQIKSKLVTGYILYSGEVRKDRTQNNPDCTFGDISRMVGNEWRSLPAYERQVWEERASKCNGEMAIKFAEEHGCPSPAPQNVSFFTAEPLPNQIFECGWDKCDWQFEDPMDCFDHCIAESTGHVQTYYANFPSVEPEYTCLWRNCIRMKKKNFQPFPHMTRLIKHVRDVHVNKSGRIVNPADRSKNLMPSKKQSMQAQQQLQQQQQQQQHQQQYPQIQNTVPMQQQQQQQPIQQQQLQQNNVSTTIQQTSMINQTTNQQQQHQQIANIQHLPAPEPLFVTVPPKPQRVLHSEAYIKYIDGLQNDTRFITPWEKTLKASQETVPAIDVSKLPLQWLKKGSAENPEEAVNALWKLRQFMMKDMLIAQRY